jgi:cbb3-type cytochrome oxidase subunit 3
MTTLISSGHIANAAWFAVCWLFLIAVVGSALLGHWRKREREEAAETERVLESLKYDTTHVHEMDGWS